VNRISLFLAASLACFGVGSAAIEPKAESAEGSGNLDGWEDAPIALLVDAGSGQILFEKEADRRFVPASITKVMSAFVAFELIEQGELDPGQSFTMSEALAEDWYRTGSTMFLEPGELVTVDQLLRGITSVSANDASAVLAVGAAGSIDGWTAMMNTAARKLGMHDSHFATPNGWPDEGKTFTTAYDLAILARILIARHPEKYARYFGKDGLRHNGFAQANHDPISRVVDGADGLKTGFTNQAGHGFLGSAERDGTRLLMVVAAIDYQQDRTRISRELIRWGFDAFDRTKIYSKGDDVAEARVQNGTQNSVALRVSNDIRMAIPKSAPVKPRFAVTYQGPLRAPIMAGEQVARLEMTLNGQKTASTPLIAARDVPKAGFFQRITNAFEAWAR